MTIFVTGATGYKKSGFIGSEVVKFLYEYGYEYKCLKGDMRNAKLVTKQMAGCSIVIHLAGFHNIEQGEKDPDFFFNNNVVGTWTVVRAALKNKVKKFIFASSLSVAYNRRTTYAMTKMMQEEMLQTYSDRMTVIIMRLASVYDKTHGTIGWLLSDPKNVINIYGTGQQVRDFVHVSDVAIAIGRAVMWAGGGFTCDIGTGKGSTMVSLAQVAGRKYRLVKSPMPQFDPIFLVANPVQTQAVLGFYPRINYVDFILKYRKSDSFQRVD